MPQLAKRFRIKPIPEVEALCRISKDLYNQSLYELRKKGEEEGVWLSHFELRTHMKTITNLEGNINYKLLRDAIADCVVKQVTKNVKSFFEAIKKWKKHPEEFKAKPEFPHFLGRNSMNQLQIRYKHDCKFDEQGNIKRLDIMTSTQACVRNADCSKAAQDDISMPTKMAR